MPENQSEIDTKVLDEVIPCRNCGQRPLKRSELPGSVIPFWFVCGCGKATHRYGTVAAARAAWNEYNKPHEPQLNTRAAVTPFLLEITCVARTRYSRCLRIQADTTLVKLHDEDIDRLRDFLNAMAGWDENPPPQ